MIQSKPRKGSDQVEVTFSVAVDGHGPMSVVGDFNNWDPGVDPLAGRGKKAKATVTLDWGRCYAFRYLTAGGQWLNDEAADAYEPNPFGTDNSILDLRPSP